MTKAKIAGIETYKTNSHIRIKVDSITQKRYNQFRQELIDRYSIHKKGFGNYTKLVSDGIDINVCKTEKYLHLILYGKLRKEAIQILLKYFELMEPK